MPKLTLEALKTKLKNRYEKGEFEGDQVGIFEEPLNPLSNMRIGFTNYSVVEPAYLVMIDEAPGAFWNHPVVYELHALHSDEVREIYEDSQVTKPSISKLKILYRATKRAEKQPLPQREKKVPGVLDIYMPPLKNKHKHAILVAGPNGNFQYDLANMRDVLLERYAFDRDLMQILVDDGQPFIDEDLGISIRADGPATRQRFDELLISYGRGGKQELGKDDTLFIYVFSHGGKTDDTHFFATFAKDSEGNAQDEYYYDFELAGRASYINCAQLVVVMISCRGGGFSGELIKAVSESSNGPDKTVFMAATLGRQLAWTLRFDETDFLESRHNVFSVFFYSALNEGYPAVILEKLPDYAKKSEVFYDTDGDGRVSVMDAWMWADYMMRNHNITTLMGMELASYMEFPRGAGKTVYLGKPELMVREYSPTRRAYDIFFVDPAALTDGEPKLDDRTALPESKYFRGNMYQAGEQNLIGTIVYNIGTAPCHDIRVEFRVQYNRGYYLVGTCPIDKIDTRGYGYAYVPWLAPSSIDVYEIESIVIRVTSPADPAPPFKPGLKEIRECRQMSCLTNIISKSDKTEDPFQKIRSFSPIYKTFKRLVDKGYELRQFRKHSRAFQLVFNNREFDGFAIGSLEGKVIIKDKKEGEGISGWVSVKFRADQKAAFRRDQNIEEKVPLAYDGRYHFQLLPAGIYYIHVECPAGNEDDTVEIKKYKVTEKNFTFHGFSY